MKNYENYDPLYPDQPVVDLYLPMWSNLSAFKSKPAFIWVENDTSNVSFISYFQLNSSVSSISSILPLQRGETVVVLCSPGLELIQVIFACQRAGLVIVPLYPSLPPQNYHHLVRVLSQTTPKAAIAHRSYITQIHTHITSRNDTKLAHMLNSLTWIATEDIVTESAKVDGSAKFDFDFSSYGGRKPDETYLIQYTSGTTGPPKPVIITAGAAAHNARAARRAYDLHPNSVIASWLPQYHDCGLMFLLLSVVSGSTSVLTSPESFLRRPRIWLDMMSFFRATCSPVPSFALPLVLKRGEIDQIRGSSSSEMSLHCLRNLILINEPISRSVVEEFVDVFKPFGLSPSSVSPSYGLAENCTFVSTSWRPYHSSSSPLTVGQLFPCHNGLLPSARLGQVGGEDEDDADVDLKIVVVNEETLDVVKDGVEGEILVSSPSNGSGYLGHPGLTRKVFHGRLFDRCFVRTGDRGVVVLKEKERYLFVTGRWVDVIKLSDKDREIHAHYVETSAYDSNRRFLRGGCLAAFQVASTVVVVAEVLEINNKKLMSEICEGIRTNVWKEHGVEIGLVVLVKSGCVPKTTSGKVKRFEAKERLIGGKMKVVMEIPFGNFPYKLKPKSSRPTVGDSLSFSNQTSLLSLL